MHMSEAQGASGEPVEVPMVSFQSAYQGRSPFASSTKPPWTHRYVPFVESMKGYSRDRFGVDALAGYVDGRFQTFHWFQSFQSCSC